MRRFLESCFEQPGGAGRITPLEGMRGFAALLVFFVHFGALFGNCVDPGSVLSRMSRNAAVFGHVGVDVFFALSGFLIYGIVMRGRSSFLQYLLRRFKRLYPVFAVVFAAYLAISLFVPSESKLPHQAPQAVLYVAANLAMLPGIFPIEPIITVAWSLSYEWAFYLILPLLVYVLRLRNWSRPYRIVLFLSLAGILMGSIHIRMIMFVAGIILWELTYHRTLGARLPRAGEYLVIVAFCANLLLIGNVARAGGEVAGQVIHASIAYSGPLFVSTFALTLYSLFFDGILKRIFSWSCIRWVGNMSYSYYLIHGMALHAVQRVLNAVYPQPPQSSAFFLVLFVLSLSATILAASGLYLWIEKPLSLDGSRSAHQAAPAAAPPQSQSAQV